MRTSGRGGYAAISAGDPTAVPAPPAWAAATTYKLDQVVSVGSGAATVQAQCVLPHTAAATGLSVAAGVLSGADASNWRLVPTGALVSLRNWTYDSSEATTTETYVNEMSDRTVGTTLTTTGQLVVADNDEDGFDVAQRALKVQNEFALKLYPKGIASGNPMYAGTARITSESSGFSTSVQERTFAFAIQGDWVRSRQA